MTTVLTERWGTDMNSTVETLPELHGTDIAPKRTTKVCFVCTGNTCRSPMAAAVYNFLNRGSDRYAVSMGLYAPDGMPISANAVLALEEAGIISDRANPYREHKAKSCTLEALRGCDYIVGISDAHTLELVSRYPELVSRIYSMPAGISDPYGSDLTVYKECLKHIEAGIKELFNIDDRDS